MTPRRDRILVLCTGNSCRSQMAEAYLRHFGGEALEVSSAGVVAHGVDPRAVAVMKEDGVDISQASSKTMEVFAGRPFDLVITVCDNAREHCPWFPSATERLHYAFPDPTQAKGTDEEVMAEFRRVRDHIRAFCSRLAAHRSTVGPLL